MENEKPITLLVNFSRKGQFETFDHLLGDWIYRYDELKNMYPNFYKSIAKIVIDLPETSDVFKNLVTEVLCVLYRQGNKNIQFIPIIAFPTRKVILWNDIRSGRFQLDKETAIKFGHYDPMELIGRIAY